ncbi:MAG: PBP1A family penicillin-binding protein [Myxococcota bacterium]|nr:PBP1A family penicillin-binding protein [Myxococcota bacterium]
MAPRPAAAPPPPPKTPRRPSSAKAEAPKKKRGLFGKLLRVGVALTLLGGIAGAATLGGAFWYYSQDLPTLETLENYRPPTVTVVYDRNGELLGEIYEQRRYVVPIEEIPKHTRYAFMAAEDANFENHGGVDLMGIGRAMWANLKAGGMEQGASTITQQVARNFLLTKDKKISRKMKEMVLATRVEEAFDKDEILHLYLNEIYLGSGAYGVEAAARIYFDKHVQDLTLAESALLAGLPQRPSDYSPHRNWKSARGRQTYVLRQMKEKGFISQAEHDAALDEEIRIVKSENPIRKLAPYYTEHVRRHLVDTYGFDRVYNEGLVVHTTCDLELQQVAQTAVTEHITDQDMKFGWRGPIEALKGDAAIKARLETQEQAMREQDQFLEDNARRNPVPAQSSLREGERFEAVVLEVERKHAIVGIGRHRAIIPLSWTKWSFEPNPERSWRYRGQDDLSKALNVGDVVMVTVEALDSQSVDNLSGYDAAKGKAAVKLYQDPELQGALLAYDLDDGRVIAMVGGVDIEDSEFNRAIQAKRQVGSTFKPIVYATAINEKKFTAGSMVLDAPLTFYDHSQGKMWKPGNYGEDYLGNISLRRGLALSRNVVTVRVLDVIGMEVVYDMARNLGIESEMSVDLSMGLGSGSITMIEMARAYSVFATYGKKVEPYFIERIEDRDGNVLEQHKLQEPEQVLDPTVAGIVTWLLHEVATAGTGAATNRLGTHVAGKTGTTNDFKDGWFTGFSPGIVTTTWAGYDQPRSMGVSSTGGRVSLPMWMAFMEKAWPKDIDRDFDPIPGAVWAPIDESTGNVARGGRSMPFVPGTVPDNIVGEVGQAAADDTVEIY